MKTAVRQLQFKIPEGGSPEYIDLAECLSQVNRQLYRQGNVFLVESFTWQHEVENSHCTINSLPTSWTVYQSWKKAYRLWNKMNRKAAAGLGPNAYPAYHDYKVFMDEDHYVAHTSLSSNLLPRDGALDLFSNVGREWGYSQYVAATAGGAAPPSEMASHMLGDDSNVANGGLNTDGSNAIIQMYGDTRVTVGEQEPNLPGDASDSWATELLDEGNTVPELIQHLEGLNDSPPYARALDAEGGDNPIYVGGSESGVAGHHLARLAPIATETVYVPGGEVPCGLLQVYGTSGGKLVVNLAPGGYQGIAAMPMGKVQT